MAKKFSFNLFRTAISDFIKADESIGSEVLYIPRMQMAPVTMNIAGVVQTTVLKDDDFGKVIFLTQTGGSDSAITLPPATAGGTLTFIVALTPGGAGDIVITAAVADTIVFAASADAGADGATNLLADSFTVEAAAIGGERIECVSDGSFWYVYAHQGVIGAVTAAG
tara:strand:+ start:553 stop:1053 length:501 start_codon:yes stop_codon:yes gene_type:complete